MFGVMNRGCGGCGLHGVVLVTGIAWGREGGGEEVGEVVDGEGWRGVEDL